MKLKQAQEILEPYGFHIRFNDALKLYEVILDIGCIYITTHEMGEFDVPAFKVKVAMSIIKNVQENPQILIH